jgi:hypothetical protein
LFITVNVHHSKRRWPSQMKLYTNLDTPQKKK